MIVPMLCLFHLFGIQSLSISQENQPFDLMNGDIRASLPSLEALIDSAYSNSPQMQVRFQQIEINEHKLRSKRIEWTKSIGVHANLGYGNMYNYTTSATGTIEPVPVASIRSQSQYTTSVFLNLPLTTITDRGNQIKIAKAELLQARNLIEEHRMELRQLVILSYNDLVLKHKIFILKSNKLESIKVNMQMAETQFMNGLLPLSEYSQLSGNVSETEIDFEKARSDFLNAYLILEETVGFKLNLFNTSSETNEPD